MIFKIFLIILFLCMPMNAQSSENENKHCEKDDICLEIYSRSIRQAFEAVVSAGKIDKNDINMFAVRSDTIISDLNDEFETKIFSKACSVSGRVYSYKYNDPSMIEFGIYQVNFLESKDMDYIVGLLGNVKRKHFRTKKIPTMFTWHKGDHSIIFIFETILVGHEKLDKLEK